MSYSNFKAICYVCGKIGGSSSMVSAGTAVDPLQCFQDNLKCMTCGKIPRSGTFVSYRCSCSKPIFGHYTESDDYIKFVHCNSHGHYRHKECTPINECPHGISLNSVFGKQYGCIECWISEEVDNIMLEKMKLPENEREAFVVKMGVDLAKREAIRRKGGDMFCATHQLPYYSKDLRCPKCRRVA